jgi:hypothetical protein
MKRRIALFFGLWLSIILPSIAEQRRHPSAADLQIDSENLGALILGKKIKLMTHDGSYVAGKVLRAGREEIVMHIDKSEPRGASVIV